MRAIHGIKALTISEWEEQEVGDKGETAQELSHVDVGQSVFKRKKRRLKKPRNVHHKRERITTFRSQLKDVYLVASDPEDDDDIITCPVCHERGCRNAC